MLINAGPTHEKIDPVRYIGNYSSGKMGFSLATEAVKRGADVTLVLGPVGHIPILDDIDLINVISADEMASAMEERFDRSDITILAAAVADFKPQKTADSKIKRGKSGFELALEPTRDIASSLGSAKRSHQLLIGFALETDNELDNARSKLLSKNLDLIVLNSLRDKGAGFGQDTNRVTLIDKYNNIDKFELKSKDEVAVDILNKVEGLLRK